MSDKFAMLAQHPPELSGHPSPILRQLPACAAALLSRCNFLRIEQRFTTPFTSLVGRAYLIHYTRNSRRLQFQREQLPRLGIEVSIVAGYDGEDLSQADRACITLPDGRQDVASAGNSSLATAYLSQTVKLYAALYDMLWHGIQLAFIFEDDVRSAELQRSRPFGNRIASHG